EQHHIARERVLELLVRHGIPTVFDDDGLAREAAYVGEGLGQDLGALAGAGFRQCHEDRRMPVKALILPARCETKQAAQGGLFFCCSPLCLSRGREGAFVTVQSASEWRLPPSWAGPAAAHRLRTWPELCPGLRPEPEQMIGIPCRSSARCATSSHPAS